VVHLIVNFMVFGSCNGYLKGSFNY